MPAPAPPPTTTKPLCTSSAIISAICALPNGDFVVIVNDLDRQPITHRILVCTPEFRIQHQIEQIFEKDDGDPHLLLFPGLMECDGETLYVLEELHDRIYSYNATDLTPRRMSAAKMAESLAVTTDRIFITHRAYEGIRVVDKESLELRDQRITLEGAEFQAMAVLDDLLFATEDDAESFPRATVHVFTLEGQHLRKVELGNVWDISFDKFKAAHGRLYVIECAGSFDHEDADPQAKREAGKRLLVLSPALELVQTLPLIRHAWPTSMTVQAERLVVMDDVLQAPMETLCTGRVIEMGPE